MQPELDQIRPRLKEILYGCMETIRPTKAALYLLDGDGFSVATSYGFNEGLRKAISATDPLPDRLTMRRGAFFVNALAEEPRFSEILYQASTERMLGAPIYSKGRLIGFLDLRDKAAKQPFEAADVEKAQRVIDQIMELFAQHQLFGQQSMQVSDKTEGPPAAVVRTIELARAAVARQIGSSAMRARTLTEAEMAAAATILPSILLIPGASLAAFSSFGQLAGGQIIAARGPVADDVLEQFQSKITTWVRKRGESDVLTRSNVQMPLRAAGPPVTPESFQNVLSAPVKAGNVSGLVLSAGFDRVLDEQSKMMLELALRQIQQAAEHGMSHHSFRQMRQRIAEKLIEPDFQRFAPLIAHSKRVSSMAEQFANFLGLPPHEVENVRVAGLVHDVGMRLLDYQTLYRKKDLTEAEMRLLQEHPVVGAALVADSGLGADIAHLVLCHHERVDGKGYPHGIGRDQIPVGARILHICEAFDAMTAADSYQNPLPENEAIERIARGGGAQFDPVMAQQFQQMLAASHA